MSAIGFVWLAVTLIGIANAAVFVVGYHRKSHGSWIKHTMGQNLMGFPVIVIILLTLLAVALTVGGLGPWPWIVALVGLNGVIAQRNYMLFSRKYQSRVGDPGEDTIERERRA